MTPVPAIHPDTPFIPLPERLRTLAAAQPAALAVQDPERSLTYAELDARMDRVAAALQRDGVQAGQAIAVYANASVDYVVLFLGALRAGVVVAPLAPSVTPDTLVAMLRDAQAQHLWVDASTQALVPADHGVPQVSLLADLGTWMAPEGSQPQPVAIAPEAPFNIIYSSGTTGTPKGIVQSHGMRWTHVRRGLAYGYGPASRALLSTPLYSNTTLVVFFPTLAFGGAVVLMPKFDARRYLELAQQERITHTMLVPVQYQRLMAVADFDAFDLSAFQMKFCTSAPFSAALKAEVLRRWPGGLVEFYGMTEGGGTCLLNAHEHPDKLHTVGRPAEGHDIRLIDEDGIELNLAVNPDAVGEVVGHSPGMMTGYHNQPDKTREAEWFDAQGKRFIRTGDVGRLDADGFLVLMDRRKDMIISGGFNVYPSDLEAQFRQHPAVQDVAVVGMPSVQWGETPVAFVVVRPAADAGDASPESLKDWFNARAGKTQRVAAVHVVGELPRSAIGKVLKRELRDSLAGEASRTSSN
ncbi:class I adenylate-forming enzyme family protein [Curvibacter delicatus]|jgi:acyl-CoA synthetase (AMP-forming)/AMP-acid ligase II|uniref:class I adenylate-forming enzyme family protein n=1 Tax=Curvibacter delicatus TaxID=80879 RepID=UPI00082BA7C7|nr:class I adenylate-forming enzyme family protein [Curvibacter delicatus]